MQSHEPEPLPIWFFVGLVLLVYGAIVCGIGFLTGPAATPLAARYPDNWWVAHPGLWWGGLMTAAGAVFLAIGLRGRRRA
jgi:membrane protein implicated in regulation of membrane protease activity